MDLYTLISVPVFGLLYLHTTVVVIVCLVFAYLNMRTLVKAIVHFWAQSIFWIMGKKVTITGKENIEKGQRYILVANHGSLFDIVAIVSFFPDVSWFGRERLLKIPLFGQILKMTDYIPMKAGNIRNTKEMLRRLIEKSTGMTIAMFPEGTRTLDGQINRFHKGFIYVQRASGLDILPVTLNGFYRLKPKNRMAIHFKEPLGVVIHQPVKDADLKNRKDNDIIKQIRDVIESAYHS